MALAEREGKQLSNLTLEQLQGIHPAFDASFVDEATKVLDFDASVERRCSEGGTARAAVLAQVAKLNAWLETRS